MTYEIPNLDAMNADELWAFWEKTYNRPSAARALFPDRPKRYTVVTDDLANYACNKSVAMKLRASGKISDAQIYENICESIYDKLPQHARW